MKNTIAIMAIIIFLIALFNVFPAFGVILIISIAAFITYDYVSKTKKQKNKKEESLVKTQENNTIVNTQQRTSEKQNIPTFQIENEQCQKFYDEFESMLKSIPIHEPIIDARSTRQRSDINEDIHITNVTQKTNIEKLGNFVAIDTETTGLSANSDEIIELSAIRFTNWLPTEIFTTLINPGKKIPKRASNINNIYDDMVKDAPKIETVIKDFDTFIGKDNLLGHNITFDTKFLDMAGSSYASIKRKYYDTMILAKKIDWACPPDNMKLDTLCAFYTIRQPNTGHRSSSDALATGLLFKKLVDEKLY